MHWKTKSTAPLAILLYCAACWGSSAWAQRRAVVLSLSGASGPRLTSEIRRALVRQLQLVEPLTYLRAARGGGNAARVAGARAVRASAIVSGNVKRKRRSWVLRLTVHNGFDGEVVGSTVFSLRRPRLDQRTRRKLINTLLRFCARTVPPDAAPAEPAAPAPAPAPPRRRAPPQPPKVIAPPPEPAPRPPKTPSGDEDLGFSKVKAPSPVGDRVNPTADPRIEKPRSKPRPSWQHILDISAGLTVLRRSFNFVDPVEPTQPANYTTPGVVPAVRVDANLYPFAALTRGFWGHIGIRAHFLRVLGLKSQLAGLTGRSNTLIQTLEAGARYRFNLKDDRLSPTIYFGADFGLHSFAIAGAEQAQIPLPNISYAYINMALAELDYPFYASGAFVIGAHAAFDLMVVLTAGDIEAVGDLGYGRAATVGLDATVGLFARYHGWFARLDGFYRRFTFTFNGDCYLEAVVDKDGKVVKDRRCGNYAGGARDVYLGGTLAFGYAY
ncbi:MAG: hypothetical protein H6707_20005 [Deltaproteobacteria bacterium]|nr:hypothetical protein [Deltaproteobacteria bacterium]